MTLNIINVILWSVVGVINFVKGDINKFDYALVWILLMINLVAKCFSA
jgi:hypothetical protein